MSFNDDEPLPKRQKRGRKEPTRKTYDLKRFSRVSKEDEEARKLLLEVDLTTSLGHIKNNVVSIASGLDINSIQSQANEVMAMYTSDASGPYTGKKILFLNKDHHDVFISGSHLNEEELFDAIAFASSLNELIRAKTSFRRVLIKNSNTWKPKLQQFLAILSTAFGVDLNRLFNGNRHDLIQNASSFSSKWHFQVDSRKSTASKQGAVKLDNLDALLEILCSIDWDLASDANDGSYSDWVIVLLTLSLDSDCRTRCLFQASIEKCIRSICRAVGNGEGWEQFGDRIQWAISGSWSEVDDCRNMGHLCSLLPAEITRESTLRSASSFGCISAMFGNWIRDHTTHPNDIIPKLVKLFRESNDNDNENGPLHNARTLSVLLELVQYILTPTIIAAATVGMLDILMEHFEGLVSVRRQNSTGNTRISTVDTKMLLCAVGYINSKLKKYKTKSDNIFIF